MIEYLHLLPSSPVPAISNYGTFKAIIVAELPTSAKWRFDVGTWLIECSCRFAMAWGEDCSAWDDDIDWAHLEKWSFGDSPEEHFVITTWHEKETLDDVFESAQFFNHPVCDINRTLILHIAPTAARETLLMQYARAVETTRGLL